MPDDRPTHVAVALFERKGVILPGEGERIARYLKQQREGGEG